MRIPMGLFFWFEKCHHAIKCNMLHWLWVAMGVVSKHSISWHGIKSGHTIVLENTWFFPSAHSQLGLNKIRNFTTRTVPVVFYKALISPSFSLFCHRFCEFFIESESSKFTIANVYEIWRTADSLDTSLLETTQGDLRLRNTSPANWTLSDNILNS